MHSAVCSDCGRRCEVPFRPTGEKPVFCSDCFSKKRDGDNDRAPKREFNNREPRNNFNDRFNDKGPKKDFPRHDTPKHFEGPKSGGNDEIKKQLEMLNSKMDKLIESLNRPNSQKVEKAAPVKEALPARNASNIVNAGGKKTIKPAKSAVAKKLVAKKTVKVVAKTKKK